MAAKICRKCREQINAKASICPHCRSRQKSWLIPLLIILASLIVIMQSTMPGVFSTPKVRMIDAQGSAMDAERLDRIYTCTTRLKRDMDDPGSADFPNPYADPALFRASNGPEGMTENFSFRAKNKFGGVQKYFANCLWQNGALIADAVGQ
jgi:hypothetical protein